MASGGRAPRTRAEYLAEAYHVTVVDQPQRTLDLDEHIGGQGDLLPGRRDGPGVRRRSPRSCAAGTSSPLRRACCVSARFTPSPARTRPSLPDPADVYVWSRRDHDDPAHRWIRAEVEAAAKPVAAQAR